MATNFWDKVTTRRGSKYLFIVSNDNNDEAPEWVIRWWNITGHNNIRNFGDFSAADENEEFTDWAGPICHMDNYSQETEIYNSLSEAQTAMKAILKSI